MATEKKRSRGSKKRKRRGEPVDGRELRARMTRAKIRRAAGKLIVEKGWENTTVDDIAARARIAKGTFYLHFNRKEDLILEYAESRLGRAADLLTELLLLPTVKESLLKMVNVVLKGKHWHPKIVKLVLLELEKSHDRLRSFDLRRILIPIIELGVSRDEIRTDIPVEILATFVADTIYAGLRNWGMGLSDPDLDRVIDYSVALSYDGIRKR